MKSKILKGGVLRAVHVFVPALQERFAKNEGQPVWAVRSSIGGFLKMIIVSYLEIDGKIQCVEHFDMPLPGTGGRGVALVYTTAPIKIFFNSDKPEIITVKVDASSPPFKPVITAPIVKPPTIKPEPSASKQVWYTAKSGRKARYNLLGFVNDGKLARLLADGEGMQSFKVRSSDISDV